MLCIIHLQPWLQAFLQLSCSDVPQYKCLQVGQPLPTNKTCHNVFVLCNARSPSDHAELVTSHMSRPLRGKRLDRSQHSSYHVHRTGLALACTHSNEQDIPTIRWTLPKLSTANWRRLLNMSVIGSSQSSACPNVPGSAAVSYFCW